jgi:AcrR family transcriptional regulator
VTSAELIAVSDSREETRLRVVLAAASLVARGGREALTTRSVAAAANVQAPTIYRLFGDKDGLIDAVVMHGYRTFLEEKAARRPGPDPVEDLRRGWDLHVAFGLSNPALYVLMYGNPRPGSMPAVIAASRQILAEHVRRVAAAGRLRVPEEQATELIHAAGSGTVFSLLATDKDRRDPHLSALAREAVIAAGPDASMVAASVVTAAAAIALRARLPQTTALSEAERQLLAEWLQRIAH